jgi:hypothetical protein
MVQVDWHPCPYENLHPTVVSSSGSAVADKPHHCRLRDLDAELEPLAMNAQRTADWNKTPEIAGSWIMIPAT